ncbi:MAG: hypothetical protein Q8N17_05895 [Burkholderiaceae bacterium]|nr:hypothetical protein [Burkholderiaceae bacterium]
MKAADAAPATVLTSAVGLGVYIPALLNQRRLRALGQAADAEVLEEHYTPDKLRAHLASRQAHRDNFALAQMANRMARDVASCLDETRVAALLERWAGERRTRFIVWSGFWLPVIERYRAMAPSGALQVDHCRIDAELSASFRIFPSLRASGREVWLWHGASGRIEHEIPISGQAPLPWDAREDRLLAHGGGWGIGTYREWLDALAATPFEIDTVVHEAAEATERNSGGRCFMMDPQWQPWRRDGAGELGFPPMGLVEDGVLRHVETLDDHHALHQVIRSARAIVSKPGGCTLIDSLAAATPVVLLEPYGPAEQANADIWQALGYGISMADWRASGFSAAILERLHRNILARRATPAYP